MDRTFNLSKLVQYLHETLIFTEEVKNVLQSNCAETVFCLKPWYMEVISQQEIEKNTCICVKPEFEIEEIAAGISRTLLQTQQLRETLSQSVAQEKRSNCFRMYGCSEKKDNKERRNVSNFRMGNKHSKEDLNTIKESREKVNFDKTMKNEIEKASVSVKSKERRKDNKKAVGYPIKLTEPKNFLAINKKSVKNMSEIKKHTNTNYELQDNSNSSTSIRKLKYIKFAERHSAASTNELKSLIQKVSSKSNSSTTSNECTIKCPLHGDVSSLLGPKLSSVSMNIVDGLSVTNIPSEIIKGLKIYHTYLDVEHSKKLPNEKVQKVFHKFLAEFGKTDKIVQEKLTNSNHNVPSLYKFISFFQPLFSKNLDISNITDIKAAYTKLTPILNAYEMKKFDSKQILERNIEDWMPNGVWNFQYFKSLEGMTRACCIRYTKKEQLLLFFDTMQQLQHVQYCSKLIKTIVEDVLPYILNSANITQSECIEMYKMISVLQQGLNSNVPVLVRTDI